MAIRLPSPAHPGGRAALVALAVIALAPAAYAVPGVNAVRGRFNTVPGFQDINGAVGTVVFPSVSLDTTGGGHYNAGTGVFTAWEDGLYDLSGMINAVEMDGGTLIGRLRVNGAEIDRIAYDNLDPGDIQTVPFLATMPLSAGDEVEVAFSPDVRVSFSSNFGLTSSPSARGVRARFDQVGQIQDISPAADTVLFPTVDYDTAGGAYNAATGVFSAWEDGLYDVRGTLTVVDQDGGSFAGRVMVNGATIDRFAYDSLDPLDVIQVPIASSTLLRAGDQVEVAFSSDDIRVTLGSDLSLAATPGARGVRAVFDEIGQIQDIGDSPANVLFPTIDFDTAGGAYDPGAGLFTAWQDGLYDISGTLTAVDQDGGFLNGTLQVNGESIHRFAFDSLEELQVVQVPIATTAYLEAGDQVGVVFSPNTRLTLGSDLSLAAVPEPAGVTLAGVLGLAFGGLRRSGDRSHRASSRLQKS